MHVIKGDVVDCIRELNRIYPSLNVDLTFPAQDTIAGIGKHGNTPQKCAVGTFPIGSIFKEEGEILYSMIRAINPQSVIEVGTWYGCSATHMAKALMDLQSKIKIYAIDNAFDGRALEWDSGNCATIGSLIPDIYRPYVDIHLANMEDEIIKFPDNSVDFIFEDSAHTYYTTHFMAMQAQRVLKPGGFFTFHDVLCSHINGVFHEGVISEVMQKGLKDAGIFDEVNTCLVNPSTFGLGIWQKP
jgi:predicted O-methyltransferase YrrM